MDHYQFLNIDPGASAEEIAQAVERVYRQANALAAVDPERSQALRERLRQVRADLLSSPADRAAYDTQLDEAGDGSPMASRDVGSPPPGYDPQQTTAQTRWNPAAGYPASPAQPARSGSTTWLPIAALIVLALVIGGLGGFLLFRTTGSHSGAGPVISTATPLPTVAPTVAHAANVKPTNTPRPTPTIQPADTPPPTITPIPDTPPPLPTVDPVQHDLQVIQSKGYTPDETQYASTDDGSGGTLYAWLGRCTDGSDACDLVFFFINAHYLGTDTFSPSKQITRVAAAGPQAIAVTYGNYLTGDSLCCPSGTPVTITYTWIGNKLAASGTPPGHEG